MQLIEHVLGTKNKIRVLRHLIRHKNWEFNISELSKDTDINKGVLSRLIKDLEKENIIRVNKKGRILLFSINRNNIIIKKTIIPLFEKEANFFEYFVKPKLLKLRGKNVISIILYGSFSSKNAKLTSDIDLLLVVKNENKNLSDKSNKVKEEFLKMDILLRADIMSLKEFKQLYHQKEPLIRSIEKNHTVLYGKKIRELTK